MSDKYNRTPHLPNSPGVGNDDRIIKSLAGLVMVATVATEKLDGSNVCLTSETVYARSHNGSPKHPSFDALKAFHAAIKHLISPGISVFAEWCWAVHSIEYTALPNPPLFIFGVRDDYKKLWWPWQMVGMMAEDLGVQTPPEAGEFLFTKEQSLLDFAAKCEGKQSFFGGPLEGLVIRRTGGFTDEEFPLSIAKWVRKDHVQTTEHWMNQAVKKQKLVEVER